MIKLKKGEIYSDSQFMLMLDRSTKYPLVYVNGKIGIGEDVFIEAKGKFTLSYINDNLLAILSQTAPYEIIDSINTKVTKDTLEYVKEAFNIKEEDIIYDEVKVPTSGDTFYIDLKPRKTMSLRSIAREMNKQHKGISIKMNSHTKGFTVTYN